jgi:hypothetical protein
LAATQGAKLELFRPPKEQSALSCKNDLVETFGTIGGIGRILEENQACLSRIDVRVDLFSAMHRPLSRRSDDKNTFIDSSRDASFRNYFELLRSGTAASPLPTGEADH